MRVSATGLMSVFDNFHLFRLVSFCNQLFLYDCFTSSIVSFATFPTHMVNHFNFNCWIPETTDKSSVKRLDSDTHYVETTGETSRGTNGEAEGPPHRRYRWRDPHADSEDGKWKRFTKAFTNTEQRARKRERERETERERKLGTEPSYYMA